MDAKAWKSRTPVHSLHSLIPALLPHLQPSSLIGPPCISLFISNHGCPPTGPSEASSLQVHHL